VPPGSRLVGLVGEAPSARLDEAESPELLPASCGLTTGPSIKWAAGRYRMYGLLCGARVEGRLIEVPLGECEAKKGSPNRQLLKDYAYWFWNNR
jgi:hypothetical protein